jgi:hypothetical protein
MTLTLSLAADQAMLQALLDTIGASPKLRLYDGSDNLIAEGSLPASPFAAISGRSAAFTGSWTATGTALAGAGVDAARFELCDSSNNPHYEGTAGETADSADMTLNNKNISDGQTVTVTTFSITQDNS